MLGVALERAQRPVHFIKRAPPLNRKGFIIAQARPGELLQIGGEVAGALIEMVGQFAQ